MRPSSFLSPRQVFFIFNDIKWILNTGSDCGASWLHTHIHYIGDLSPKVKEAYLWLIAVIGNYIDTQQHSRTVSPSPSITSYLGLILHRWWCTATTTETDLKTQMTFNLTFDTTLSNKTVIHAYKSIRFHITLTI